MLYVLTCSFEKTPKASYFQSHLFIYIFYTKDLRVENNVDITSKIEKEKLWRLKN